MTRVEAIGSEGQSAPRISPILFLPLFAPFGMSAGYVSVTLGYLLGHAGMATAAISVLVAWSIWPQTWKILWAPIVDTVGNPKLWYGAGAVMVGLCFLLMSFNVDRSHTTLLTILIVISSIASTLMSMSAEIFMAHFVRPEQTGRASGWAQAGNLGGSGLGGGLGLYLAQHVAMPWVSGAVLCAVSIACWLAVFGLPPAPREHRALNYLESLKGVGRDLWEMSRSRVGYLGLIIMLLPLGSGGAQGIWAAIASEWRASADTVALVNGVVGGIAAAIGCLIGGYVCDRMDFKRAYCLFGILCGVVAVAMNYAPRDPSSFVVFTLAYAVMIGCCYAGYNAIVLEAIGKGAAATKFNLFAALANVPIGWMTQLDGSIHDSHGTSAMLWLELAAPSVAVALFALFTLITRPKRRTT